MNTKKPNEKRKNKYLTNPQYLPEKLKIIRLSKKLTQTEMVTAINPMESPNNHAKISQFERGKRTPHATELLNYARLAGITMEHLVDDEMELPEHLTRS